MTVRTVRPTVAEGLNVVQVTRASAFYRCLYGGVPPSAGPSQESGGISMFVWLIDSPSIEVCMA
jgi:hypothetical protein